MAATSKRARSTAELNSTTVRLQEAALDPSRWITQYSTVYANNPTVKSPPTPRLLSCLLAIVRYIAVHRRLAESLLEVELKRE